MNEPMNESKIKKIQVMPNPITITDDTFDAEVVKSDLPVLLDIWAPWCGPCRLIAPAVEAIAEEFKGRLKVGKLNVDENPKVAALLGVTSIPALVIYQGGQPRTGIIGVQTQAMIEKMIEPFLSKQG
jgi:thioredoxin 1